MRLNSYEKLTKKKIYYNIEKLEEFSIYLERNKSMIDAQFIEIIEKIKERDKKFETIPLTTDIFLNVEYRKINENLETVFTDKEAVLLCSKLSTPFVRKLLLNSRNNINELHKIAMKCYNKYGGQIISFLLLLPIMKFENRQSKYFIEKSEYEGEIPSFRLKFLNSSEEYYFSFYPSKENIKRDIKIATIFNKSRNIIEGFVSYNGYTQSKVAKENLRVNLFVQNLICKTKVFFCGVADGFCLKCNRELSDPKSLRVGYGKECASEIGVPYD